MVMPKNVSLAVRQILWLQNSGRRRTSGKMSTGVRRRISRKTSSVGESKLFHFYHGGEGTPEGTQLRSSTQSFRRSGGKISCSSDCDWFRRMKACYRECHATGDALPSSPKWVQVASNTYCNYEAPIIIHLFTLHYSALTYNSKTMRRRMDDL